MLDHTWLLAQGNSTRDPVLQHEVDGLASIRVHYSGHMHMIMVPVSGVINFLQSRDKKSTATKALMVEYLTTLSEQKIEQLHGAGVTVYTFTAKTSHAVIIPPGYIVMSCSMKAPDDKVAFFKKLAHYKKSSENKDMKTLADITPASQSDAPNSRNSIMAAMNASVS
eukprot:TRINITY_DN106309_c0_g1_i1.p2 TRINITY_DN106309_c0_g1~~TRINITY_DN106309_c0_g1_i1.p2  ORF type:complete len:167 (-),score=44.88 TRINITY_DN106309_c0_g1_i1:21-521(-)